LCDDNKNFRTRENKTTLLLSSSYSIKIINFYKRKNCKPSTLIIISIQQKKIFFL
jgi:hypothetical protein